MSNKKLKIFPLFGKQNQIFHCYGIMSDKNLSYKNYFELGSSCDTSKEKALTRALGEHIERKTIYRISNKMIVARGKSFRDLEKKQLLAIPPKLFCPFSNLQLASLQNKKVQYF